MLFETFITGLSLAGAIYYRATIDYRRLKPYKERWSNLMRELGLQTKETKSTFLINSIKSIENGFVADIYIPDGLSYTDLEKNKEKIENSFCANITIENKQFSNKCAIKFLDKELEDYDFEPVKTREYELFIGKTYDNKNYILDMNKNSHVLILGATGGGKTTELMMILTNLIYNSSDKIELHLSQIKKSETGAFRDCVCVKFYSTKLEDVSLDLERVAKQINYRSERFDYEGVSNIQEYNKYNKNRQMKRIYYVIEELSFFMPQASDMEEIKNLKNRCWSSILEIVKAGRSVGLHFLSVSQRSTCTNLPSDIKSQVTRISFAQISKVDSQNAIECENAIYLKDKQCLIYGDGRAMETIKVPTLKNGNISLYEFVPEIRIPRKYKDKEKKEEAAVDTVSDETKINNEDKVEKVFYEDKRVSDEELKEYYKSLYKKNNVIKDDVTYINKTSRPGVIKGGAIKNADKKG